MPSDLRGLVSPRTCRGVAFAATPNARRWLCEPLSPLPERGFAKVQPLALIASGLENQVDMRMRLIGMQSHHIAMLESELLPGEIPHRRLDLLGRRSGRHGEYEFVDQSWRLLWLIGGQIDLAALLDQIKIPILQ